VVVVGADATPHQLAEGVELLREQLAGGHHGESVAPVFLLDLLDLTRAQIERGIPIRGLKFILKTGAHQGLAAPARGIEQLVLENTLEETLINSPVIFCDNSTIQKPL